jgi:hypothetical protein
MLCVVAGAPGYEIELLTPPPEPTETRARRGARSPFRVPDDQPRKAMSRTA